MQNQDAQIEVLAAAPARPWSGLTGKVVELAAGVSLPCGTLRFSRNDEVFAEEERAEFVYKVLSGTVRDVRVLSDGRRQVGAFHLVGEVFGLDCGATHRYSAEAVVDCEIAVVRRSTLNRAADADGAAARKLWDLSLRDLQHLQDHMLLLGRKSAVERVASFLRNMFLRNPAGNAVNLAMSRTDIADYLGLTIETISRTLTQLERAHAISMQTSRRIVLHSGLASAEG